MVADMGEDAMYLLYFLIVLLIVTVVLVVLLGAGAMLQI
jgi:hypothetical protein